MKSSKILVQCLMSAVCLAAGVMVASPGALPELLARAALGPLTMVFLLMPLAIFSRAWRWWYILKRKRVEVSFAITWRATLIGHAYNLFLPGSLGDVVRSYYGWREQGSKEAMLASAVVDKVVALFSLCFLGVGCALAVRAHILALVTTALMLPLAFMLLVPQVVPWKWGANLFRKLFHRDMSVEQLANTFRLDFQTLLGCLAISLLGWGITNMMYYYAWFTFSPTVSIWYAFAVAPLINLMRVLPITVSGLGSADLLIMFMSRSVGMHDSDALMGSMVINVTLIALPGLMGTILMLVHRR